MNRIDGKFAVVTGGTQGLGAATARHFAAAGARGIVICGRNIARGEALAGEIAEANSCPVHFLACDLAQIDDCRNVIRKADAEFGKIDILVNAAAITDRGTILDTSPELFDAMFAVNVRGPFFLIQEAAKLMIREETPGSIINIGSVSAHSGQPFISAYCASKGALATLTGNTAFGLMRNHIRCNQLNIGWMASDGEDRIQKTYHNAEDDWVEKASRDLPFGRLVSPQEIARAVTYLASDDSGLMTGSIIHFDQSVLGASNGAPPSPDAAMSRPE